MSEKNPEEPQEPFPGWWHPAVSPACEERWKAMFGTLQYLMPPLRTRHTFVPENLIISLLPHHVQGFCSRAGGEAQLSGLAGNLIGASPELA